MAINDRKKRILEHLKQSTDGTEYISVKQTVNTKTSPITTPQQTPETVASPDTTPEPTLKSEPVSKPIVKENRKRKIMSHVNNSSSNFGTFSLKDESKKKKIEEHIRKSLS
ncbi:MAG: hypothetical protein AB4062_00610 [Crocosphaera sp.]